MHAYGRLCSGGHDGRTHLPPVVSCRHEIGWVERASIVRYSLYFNANCLLISKEGTSLVSGRQRKSGSVVPMHACGGLGLGGRPDEVGGWQLARSWPVAKRGGVRSPI